jgi:hypothetical protein
MAIFIIDEPYAISWSRNPVRYAIHTDTAIDTPGLVLEVKVRFRSGEDLFKDIVTQSLSPDPNGNVFLDISFILDSLLSFDLPNLTAPGIQQVVIQRGEFFIEFRELTSTSTDTEWLSTVDKKRIVLKGGLSFEAWQGGNFFIEYLPANKAFMTWIKTGYLAKINESLFLHFLSYTDETVQVRATVKIMYADGTEDNTVSLAVGPSAGISKFQLFIIPSGAIQLGIDSLSVKAIRSWEVSVVSGSTILAGPYRYTMDYRYDNDEVNFNFYNSLGGIDSIRIRGKWETEHVRETAEVERLADSYYYNSNELPAMIDDAIFKERITWKGNAGYMTRALQDSYRELLLSRKRMVAINKRWVNARILNKTTKLYSKGQQLPDFPIEWAFSYDNVNFTPSYVQLSPISDASNIPHNLRITAVSQNKHTIEWDADDALAFSIEGDFYDNVEGNLVNSTPIPFKRSSQNKMVLLDLKKYRHARLKIVAYGSGFISGASALLTFPLLNNAACPPASGITLTSWVDNIAIITWEGNPAHSSYEVMVSLTEYVGENPTAPPIVWYGLYLNDPTATLNTLTYTKLSIKIRCLGIGLESSVTSPTIYIKT